MRVGMGTPAGRSEGLPRSERRAEGSGSCAFRLAPQLARVFTVANVVHAQEWDAFAAKESDVRLPTLLAVFSTCCLPDVQAKEFWVAYEKLFGLVLNKWSTKGKHTLFCYDLLWKMVQTACSSACSRA